MKDNENDRQNSGIYKFSKLIITAILVLIFFALGFIQTGNYLKLKAYDDCGKISKFEKTIASEDTKVSYPVLDIYNKCIKNKGY